MLACSRVDAINRTAVHVTPFGDRLVLEDDRMAAVEARVAQLERQLAIELSYRDGLAKMNEEYTASHNASAKAEVLAMVRWREQGLCRCCSGSHCRRSCRGRGCLHSIMSGSATRADYPRNCGSTARTQASCVAPASRARRERTAR